MMRVKFKGIYLPLILVFLLAGMLFFSLQGFTGTVMDAGRIEDLQGEVFIQNRIFWFIWKSRPAFKGMVLKAGERIVTGPNSWVEGEAPSGVFFRLEEDSILDLKIMEGEEQKARLNKGEVWIKLIRDIFSGLYYKIETPSAVAVVRGTSFLVRVTPEFEEFMVSEGKIVVETPSKNVELTGLQKLKVIKGSPGKIQKWEKRDIQRWKKQQEREDERLKSQGKEDQKPDKIDGLAPELKGKEIKEDKTEKIQETREKEPEIGKLNKDF